MDGGIGAFIPGVILGLTLAMGIYQARDGEPRRLALGVAAGLALAAAVALLLGWAGSDVQRLWVLVWVLATLALAAAVSMTAGRRRRRRDASSIESPTGPA